MHSTLPPEKTKTYAPLSGTLFWIILLVSIAPLFLMTAVAAYEFNTAYRVKAVAYLDELVEKHARNVDGFLVEKEAEVRMLSLTRDAAELSDEAVLSSLLSALQKNHGGVFVDLGFVNAGGRQVAYAGPYSLKGADYSKAPWFARAMRDEKYISDVFTGLRGLPHFIVAIRKDTPAGPFVLRGTIDFAAFNLLVENITTGSTGLAFIINREGEFQTRPRVPLDSRAAAIRDAVWKSSPAKLPPRRYRSWEAFTGSAARDERPAFHFMGSSPGDGRRAIYVTATLKAGEWALVYLQDEAETFASLYTARNVTVAVLLLGGLAIAFMAAVLSRRVAGKMGRIAREKELMNEKVI